MSLGPLPSSNLASFWTVTDDLGHPEDSVEGSVTEIRGSGPGWRGSMEVSAFQL